MRAFIIHGSEIGGMAWAIPWHKRLRNRHSTSNQSHCFLYSKNVKKVSLNIGLIRNFLQYVCFWWKRWDCGCNCSKKCKDLRKSFFLVTFSSSTWLMCDGFSYKQKSPKRRTERKSKTLPPKKAVFIRIPSLTTEDRLTQSPKSSPLNSPLNSFTSLALLPSAFAHKSQEPTSSRLKAFVFYSLQNKKEKKERYEIYIC